MPAPRRLAAISLGIIALLALLGWWQPWRTTPPPTRPQPAPLPTPTALSVHLITTPSRATPVAAAATPTVTPIGTPAATSGQPRASGHILYLGYRDGQSGIISSAADGTDQRMLSGGNYTQLRWSPRGDDFVAVGPLPESNALQVAFFSPNGQPQARFAIPGTSGSILDWSPTEPTVTVITLQERSAPTLWLASPTGISRLGADLGQPLSWADWSRSGRLAVTGYEPTGATMTLWVRDTPLDPLRQVITGAFQPIGFAGDGQTFLAFDFILDQVTGFRRFDHLVAIDLTTGAQRPLLDANQLQAATGATPQPNQRFFQWSLSPDDQALALFMGQVQYPGTPSSIAIDRQLIILNIAQLLIDVLPLPAQITGVLPIREGVGYLPPRWSPDSQWLALTFYQANTPRLQLLIIDQTGRQISSHDLADFSNYNDSLLWSPDSRWLLLPTPLGLTIISATQDIVYPLTSGGTAPAWQPSGTP